jgi:hypothetical protein
VTYSQAALVDRAGAGAGRSRAVWRWALLVIREVREPTAKIFGLASVALEPAGR